MYHKLKKSLNSKSSHMFHMCSIEKPVLKNFATLTGKYLCWSLLLIDLRASGPATFLKRDSSSRVLSGILLAEMVTRCHSLSFVVTRCTTRCHSLSPVVICCHSLHHSLLLVVPLVLIRCHLLSFDVPLVCLFINGLKKWATF